VIQPAFLAARQVLVVVEQERELVVWSGRSARTEPLLERSRARKKRGPHVRAP